MKIIPFLKRNGFKKMEQNHYANDMCGVVIEKDRIVVANNYGQEVFLHHCFYALLGYLTYRKFIEKTFKD